MWRFDAGSRWISDVAQRPSRNTLRFLRATTLAPTVAAMKRSAIEVGTHSRVNFREQIYRAPHRACRLTAKWPKNRTSASVQVFRRSCIVVQPRAATSLANFKSGSTATGFATADSNGKSLIESLQKVASLIKNDSHPQHICVARQLCVVEIKQCVSCRRAGAHGCRKCQAFVRVKA